MAQFNPYAMDPALAQGFSRLSKALIGDAGQDLDIARKNRIEELLPYEVKTEEARANQANAGAYSNTMLGNRYKSETTNQDMKNEQLGALLESFKVLENSPEAAAAIMEATGINLTDPAAQSALVRALVGREGDINQTSSALTNVGEAKNTRRAENIALDPNQPMTERLLAQQLLGTTLGKYSDPTFPVTELTETNKTDITKNENDNAQADRDNIRDNETKENVANIEADAKVKEAEIEAAAREAYERYRTTAQYGPGGSEDRKQDKIIEQQKWVHNNTPLEITVADGKEIVLSPEAGVRLGIKPDEDGLYTLSGKPKLGNVVVKVGEEDVYLTPQDAELLGIPKNDAGQYVIKGNPKPTTKKSGSDKPNFSVPENVSNNLQDLSNAMISENDLDLPPQAQQVIIQVAGADYGENGSLTKAREILTKELGRVVTINPPGAMNQFNTVQIIIDEAVEFKEEYGSDKVVPMLINDLGFNEVQAQAILAHIGG